LNQAHGAMPWRNTILVGDARTQLRAMPAASVDTVITSPPYFGLRNYGHGDQIGSEGDVEGWVSQLRAVMAEVARVLKSSGSVWLNVGDGYSRHPREGAARKSLLLGPERLALALLEDGWLLRNKVIWAKTNPMPSSVRDRLSTTHEVIYLMTRSPAYFFDLGAIRVPHRSPGQPQQASAAGRTYPPPASLMMTGANPRTNPNGGLGTMRVRGVVGHPDGANPGDLWRLATAGYREAHFATFPVALVERPLLATCPERVCAACGMPWLRERKRGDGPHGGTLRPGCSCNAASRPGIVLDPFMGAGTVALAAERHNRDWVGVEPNPAYAAMAEARIRRWWDAAGEGEAA